MSERIEKLTEFANKVNVLGVSDNVEWYDRWVTVGKKEVK